MLLSVCSMRWTCVLRDGIRQTDAQMQSLRYLLAHGSLWLGGLKKSRLPVSSGWLVSIPESLMSVGTGSSQGSSQTSAAFSSSLCLPVRRGDRLRAQLCGRKGQVPLYLYAFSKIHYGTLLKRGLCRYDW